MTIVDDRYGRMTTYSRYSGAYVTEYRPDGYYWQHLNGKWSGPFVTRRSAEAAELAAVSRRWPDQTAKRA